MSQDSATLDQSFGIRGGDSGQAALSPHNFCKNVFLTHEERVAVVTVAAIGTEFFLDHDTWCPPNKENMRMRLNAGTRVTKAGRVSLRSETLVSVRFEDQIFEVNAGGLMDHQEFVASQL